MTKLASKVTLITAIPARIISAILNERALANPKLKIRCGTKVEGIVDESHVEAIEYLEVRSGQRGTLEVAHPIKYSPQRVTVRQSLSLPKGSSRIGIKTNKASI